MMAAGAVLAKNGLAGIHVLVVDDDRDAGDILRTVLEYCGARVTYAGSAREGLAVLEQIQCDVLVADIAMPEHDGYWLLRETQRRGARVPAVAITAYGLSHGPDKTYAAGFQAHLSKPVDPWELCHTVAMLRRRRPNASGA